MTPEPPRSPTERVRITSPLAHAATPRLRSPRQEIDESTAVGAIYVRSLVRAQRRAALVTSALAIISIGVLPILFWADLPPRTWTVAGVPLVWLTLGIGVYPWVWWLGRVYVRQAEHHEAIFAALVESPASPPPGPPT